MKVKDVAHISYIAVRGRDHEEGSVQRVLSKRRIDSIKEFILSGNMFFNSFILNWTDSNFPPRYRNNKISIKITPAAAQMIDGQHRLAGLEAAMEEDKLVSEKEILVSLCISLSTKEAATIFLNINSEQRPVPKSLIYDLFGEVEDDRDHSINRANDIAQDLSENRESPFYRSIKYPGAPRGVGIIDLSTIVTALKKHLAPEGIFARVNLNSLNYQKLAVMNYFNAIRSYYDEEGIWNSKTKNPFFKSAGFNGAVDYLTATLLMKCAEANSFTAKTFRRLLRLDSGGLLLHEDIKSLDGKTARKKIAEYLQSNLLKSLPEQEEYEF
jgi:DGQHR domain-containing protein